MLTSRMRHRHVPLRPCLALVAASLFGCGAFSPEAPEEGTLHTMTTVPYLTFPCATSYYTSISTFDADGHGDGNRASSCVQPLEISRFVIQRTRLAQV